MPTPDEYQRALTLITARAVTDTLDAARQLATDGLVLAGMALIAYYSDGSAALAADQYDELRESSPATKPYRATPLVNLREEKIRKGLLWAAGPLYGDFPDVAVGQARVAEVVQLETARPFRDTTLANQSQDPSSVGWRRNSNDGCKFCRLLASNGAVYKESTARFASHPHCDCTAVPVFDGGDVGPEASTLQYIASQRRKTPAQRQALNRYLAALPD